MPSDPETWQRVDDYMNATLIQQDEMLTNALSHASEKELPDIHVSAAQGKLLYLLAVTMGARRVLEVGTLAGYCALWFAKAVGPGGKVVTLETDLRHAAIAQKNIDNAGMSERIEIQLGLAAESLASMASRGTEAFDLVFIDADKPSNLVYLEYALKLTRPGSLIIVDNVVRGGEVANPESDNASVIGTQKVLEMMGSNPNLDATAIQTVGSKNYDGFAIARVLGSGLES